MSLELRPYQNDAVSSVFNYFANNGGNPLVLMPTGTGKSIVIAKLVHSVLQHQPTHRFIMATHVKELIKQNAEKLDLIMPGAPYGICSAGLKSKDFMQPVIYGGIATMRNDPMSFGRRDTLLVDEAHLISDRDEAMYIDFIRALKLINPFMKVVGFTATGYRMGMGLLTNGNIFTDVAYDITSMAEFNKLIAQGYLSLLITPRVAVQVDLAGIHTVKGEYKESELDERVSRILEASIQDTLKYASNRHSWLGFATSIETCERIAARYRELGAKAIAIHGGNKDFPLSQKECDERLADFKAGKYQIAINFNKLTTGFDHPPIDLIVMWRSSKSVPLWVQMLGRGTRPFEGDNVFPPKRNCLVLDFAGNTQRLGPINDPVIPRKKGEGGGEAPIKICDECGTYNHISARFCVGCGAPFEIAEKTTTAPSEHEVIRDAAPIFEEYKVSNCFYYRHHSKHSGLDSMRVLYYCDGNVCFEEYISIEGRGAARDRATQWWYQRSAEFCPTTIDDALKLTSHLRTPSKVLVHTNTKWPKIERCFYD